MHGAAITTTQQLAIGREYALKFRVEDDLLHLQGRVVWSVLSHSKMLKNGEVVPVYKAGVRFSNTLTDTATQLISYIGKNRHDSHEKRRLGVRLKVQQREGSEIDLSSEYRVKKISLSGMLIETDTFLANDRLYEMVMVLDGTRVAVTGRIAYQAEIKTGNSDMFDIGIEFLAMNEKAHSTLKTYLDAIEHSS